MTVEIHFNFQQVFCFLFDSHKFMHKIQNRVKMPTALPLLFVCSLFSLTAMDWIRFEVEEKSSMTRHRHINYLTSNNRQITQWNCGVLQNEKKFLFSPLKCSRTIILYFNIGIVSRSYVNWNVKSLISSRSSKSLTSSQDSRLGELMISFTRCSARNRVWSI